MSTSSSSLTPRMTTVSILTTSKCAAASARPARTASSASKRVSSRKRSGRSVSRLTVMRCRPAARSASARSGSSTPLVREREIPDGRLGGQQPHEGSARSVRSSGSPPVMRTRSTPALAKTSTRKPISSNVRMSFLGSQTYSASGMQYWQRRLQRSVTEIRRLRSRRPSVSKHRHPAPLCTVRDVPARRAGPGSGRQPPAPAAIISSQDPRPKARTAAPRRKRRGAKGSPQADAGGSGRSPVWMEAAHSAPRRKRRGAVGVPASGRRGAWGAAPSGGRRAAPSDQGSDDPGHSRYP